jgi:hypothetical protein
MYLQRKWNWWGYVPDDWKRLEELNMSFLQCKQKLCAHNISFKDWLICKFTWLKMATEMAGYRKTLIWHVKLLTLAATYTGCWLVLTPTLLLHKIYSCINLLLLMTYLYTVIYIYLLQSINCFLGAPKLLLSGYWGCFSQLREQQGHSGKHLHPSSAEVNNSFYLPNSKDPLDTPSNWNLIQISCCHYSAILHSTESYFNKSCMFLQTSITIIHVRSQY